jgi:hypothetical protein
MRSTVEVAPHGPRPAIRLRPVPRCEPLFDDELEPTIWATVDQLALDWTMTIAPTSPAPPAPPAQLAALAPLAAPAPPSPAKAPSDGSPRKPASPRSPVAGASSDAKLAVRRFVHMCVEVLNGYRPPAHLRRLSLPAEAAGVVAQGIAGAQRVAALRRSLQCPGRRVPRRPPPVAVLCLRTCEPRPGAVEAAVALITGERTWAMALRLELHRDSWSATALRLI